MNALLVFLSLTALPSLDMTGSRSASDLNMSGAPLAALQDTLPEVWAYSMPGCPPCLRAKAELSEATDLPFRVVWKDASPAWLDGRPGFWWHVSKDQPSQNDVQQTRQIVGWSGLKDFVARWKRSRETTQVAEAVLVTPAQAAAAPTPSREVERVLGLLPKPNVAFVDFGCGDGRWCIAAAERWNCAVIGIEIDPARAAATRARVRSLGLSHLVTIIEGDATTTEVNADVGVAYLYPAVLEQLQPRIAKLKAFASYLHQPPGLPAVRNGDSWLYTQPVITTRMAVWNGQAYSGPICNSPGCAMCRSIRNQLFSR